MGKNDGASPDDVLRPVLEQPVFVRAARTIFRFILIMGATLSMPAAFAGTPLPIAATPSIAVPAKIQEVEVRVQIDGANVTIDLSLVVPATRQQVWAVLTDYGHMAGFVSNLKESKVLSASGSTLKVYQRGAASYALIDFPFESTRDIQLTPFEKIQSHMVSGNMQKMEGLTQLVEEGGGTRIIYHADSIPGHWLPPFGAQTFIEHETRAQFEQMRDEILKRKASAVAQSN